MSSSSTQYNNPPGTGRVALIGAATGVVLAFAYALAFIIFAVIRLALTITTQARPDAGTWPTLLASGTSLAIATLGITCLVAILAACSGAITAVLAKVLITALNPGRSPQLAMVLGAASALALELLFQVPVVRTLTTLDVAFPLTTYLLWFGLPGMIHVIAGGIGGYRLDLVLAARPARSAPALQAAPRTQ